ncbi:O-antigen ligase family protein [Vulgatibacter incomptus]|uniref:O-antigen ligase family protein n=1 Tax=Vulgatibacter incomptus TaxID=1391653 RepID=UPI00146FE509|nr:O-antigen ligase family protein [Vulgatibacter incomptus]
MIRVPLVFVLGQLVALAAWLNLRDEERGGFLASVCRAAVMYFCVSIVYWVAELQGVFAQSDGLGYSRMGSALFRVVYMGLFVPSFGILYLIAARSLQTRPPAVFYPFILAVTLATGSRSGALVIAVAAIVLTFSVPKTAAQGLFRAVVIGAVFAFTLPALDLVSGTRYDTLSGHGRSESFQAAVDAWSSLSLFKVFFGAGWGQIYPYWTWLEAGAPTWGGKNFFYLGGSQSLVSPHNSILWFLVEGGALVASGVVFPIAASVIGCLRAGVRDGKIILCILGVGSLVWLVLISDFLVWDEAGGAAQPFFWLLLCLFWHTATSRDPAVAASRGCPERTVR